MEDTSYVPAELEDIWNQHSSVLAPPFMIPQVRERVRAGFMAGAQATIHALVGAMVHDKVDEQLSVLLGELSVYGKAQAEKYGLGTDGGGSGQ